MWFIVFFFFKQKTAYEMVMSDWSSDVCSSDLRRANVHAGGNRGIAGFLQQARGSRSRPLAPARVTTWTLECSACVPVRTRDAEGFPGVCEVCGAPYLVRYETLPPPEAKSLLKRQRWTMWRYGSWLPLAEGERPVTLGEGGTPL